MKTLQGEADALAARKVRESEEVRELRLALGRAQRDLEREKQRKADLMDAVHRAAHDAALGLAIPRVAKFRPDTRAGIGETAVVVLSDWQLGKVTPTYSTEVCEARIDRLADLVLQEVYLRRKAHPVRNLRVWLLGDIVEGNAIFPGQAYQVDSSTYAQALRDGPRILINFLRRMAPEFEAIHSVGVIGNHGRSGRRGEEDPETNWDRVLYRHVADVLEGRPGLEHLTWNIPEGKGESYWYAVDRIGRYGSLLFHGYNLRGHAGMPWYGLQKKVGGWALGAIEEFRLAADSQLDVDFGHWHQPTRVTLNDVTARCNGSTESHNTYAQEQLAAVGRPSQGLRFVDPERGLVTAEHTLWLDA